MKQPWPGEPGAVRPRIPFFWRARRRHLPDVSVESRADWTSHPGPYGTRLASSNGHRRGLTLFEVLISLVIFIGAMAAIGQLVANGVRGALQARFQAQAAMMCESKLGEVVVGIVPLVSGQAVYPDDPSWSWSLVVMAAPTPGLMRAEVTVKRQAGNSMSRVEFTMARYVRDPQLYFAAQQEAERIAQEKQEAEEKAQAQQK